MKTNHWLINAGLAMPKPPKFRGVSYDNSSKWMTDRAPQVFVDKEEIDKMCAVIDGYLKAGEYSILKFLYKFDIPDHTKVKHITARRKALNLARSRKQDDVIALHLQGLRNCEICVKLNCVKEYVSQVVKRYKDSERRKNVKAP